MNRKLILGLCLLSLFQVSLCNLFIQNPTKYQNNFKQEGITAGMANFGYYKYGHAVQGQLIVGGVKAHPDDEVMTYDGCDEFVQEFMVGKEYNKDIIVVVDRGNCTFLRKAQNAARIGAKLLVVVDNIEQDIPEQHLLVGQYDVGEQHVMMPTIMISKQDGDRLKQLYFDHLNESIELSFKMEHPNQSVVVDLEFWHDPFDTSVYSFLKNIKKFTQNVNAEVKQLNIQPRFYLTECLSCKKNGYQTKDTTGECLAGGRYCARDPDGKGALQGTDAVEQYLRSLCAFKTYGQKDWLDATLQFFETCVLSSNSVLNSASSSYLQTCYIEAVENTIIKNHYKNKDPRSYFEQKTKKYDECIDNSYLNKPNTEKLLWDNFLLREEYERAQEYSIQYTPTIFVNKMRFYGDIEENTSVEEMICESYYQEQQPVECWDFERKNELLDDYMKQFEESGGKTIVWIVLGSIILIVLFLYCLKNSLKKNFRNNMQQQVNESVNKYFSMSDKTQDL